MIYKKILLKEIDNRFTTESTSLRIYISDRNETVSNRPGILICPGGGYEFCSPREAEPIAFRFLSEGFNCFVLDYSVHKAYPAPHLDLALAISYIRNHELDFDLIPNSLSIIGFSAGGHLVGSYGYLYKELAHEIKVSEEILKPRAIIMAYPVTTLTTDTHLGTFEIISGGNDKLKEKLDIIKNLKDDYPPTFIWTTKDDMTVPYKNTEMMIEALKKHHIYHQGVIFESGWHGSSLANRSCYLKTDLTNKMKDIRDWASKVADFIFQVLEQ